MSIAKTGIQRTTIHISAQDITRKISGSHQNATHAIADLEIGRKFDPDGDSDLTITIISGKLDLSYANCPRGVIFHNCEFTDHISLAFSQFRALHFLNCKIKSLDAIGLKTTDDLSIATTENSAHPTSCHSTLRLTNAIIGKRLILNGASFSEGNADDISDYIFHGEVAPRGAIDAGCIKVGGSIWIKAVHACAVNAADTLSRPRRVPFISYGQVSFRGAKIRGKIICSRAIFHAGRHISQVSGLRDEEAEIARKTLIIKKLQRDDFCSSSTLIPFILSVVNFTDDIAELLKKTEANWQRSKAKIPKEWENRAKKCQLSWGAENFEKFFQALLSLDCYDARAEGSVLFHNCVFNGTVRFSGMNISGKFSLSESHFREVEIENLLKRNQPQNDRLAEIKYQLTRLSSALLNHIGSAKPLPRGSIDAHRIKVVGGVYLCSAMRDFTSHRIELDPARTDGSPQKNHPNSYKTPRAFYAFGRVSFSGADIGGRFIISGARFIRIGESLSDSSNSLASLELSNAHIHRNLSISGGSISIGSMLLSNTKIDGSIHIAHSLFISKLADKPALDAENIRVANRLTIEGRSCFYGKATLHSATINSNAIIKDSAFFPLCPLAPTDNGNPNPSLDDKILEIVEKHANRAIDEIFPALNRGLDAHLKPCQTAEARIHLQIGKTLLDLSECTVGGSLRFSSEASRAGYSIVWGTLQIAGANIGTELDLCGGKPAHLSARLCNYIDPEIAEEITRSIRGMPPIWRIDMRYVATKVLRSNGHLPFPGMVLVNGLEFQAISGDILKDKSCAEKFLLCCCFVTGNIGGYWYPSFPTWRQLLRIGYRLVRRLGNRKLGLRRSTIRWIRNFIVKHTFPLFRRLWHLAFGKPHPANDGPTGNPLAAIQIHKLRYPYHTRKGWRLEIRLHQDLCRNLLACYQRQAPSDSYEALASSVKPSLTKTLSIRTPPATHNYWSKVTISAVCLAILLAFIHQYIQLLSPSEHLAQNSQRPLLFTPSELAVAVISLGMALRFIVINRRRSEMLLRSPFAWLNCYYAAKGKPIINDNGGHPLLRPFNCLTFFGLRSLHALFLTCCACCFFSAVLFNPAGRQGFQLPDEIGRSLPESVAKDSIAALISTTIDVCISTLPSFAVRPAKNPDPLPTPDSEDAANEQTQHNTKANPNKQVCITLLMHTVLLIFKVLGWCALAVFLVGLQRAVKKTP